MATYSNEETLETVWTPDLIGPIFKKDSTTLREVLNIHRNDNCTRIMATFVPDELIYDMDLTNKTLRKYNAVLLLISLSRFFSLHEKYSHAECGGSYGFTETLNDSMRVIINEVYSSRGDILKFSPDGLLAIWKARKNEFIFDIVHDVILCAQRIQKSITIMKKENVTGKVDIIISAGEVIFSIIGNEGARSFVVAGTPINDLKYGRRISLPGDLILSSSAWEHCSPSQYEYVIKDSCNIKIIKVLGENWRIQRSTSVNPLKSVRHRSTVDRTASENLSERSMSFKFSESNVINVNEKIFPPRPMAVSRISVLEASRRQLGDNLRSYLAKPVLNQIDREESLDYLTEKRRLTIVSIDVIPNKCSDQELISLVDDIFLTVHSTVTEFSGCIFLMNLYDRSILLCVAYGLSESSLEKDEDFNTSANGVLSCVKIMESLKSLPGIKAIFIGVSTGIAFCGMVGHTVRREYMIIGTPVDKSMGLMHTSYDMISCDYDTVLRSSMAKRSFRSRGMKTLKKFGKCHVYEFLPVVQTTEQLLHTDLCYPLLGRFEELECFKDILDEIGVAGRSYSGLLIQGSERSGKSRLLDAFASITRNRQIRLLRLSLHPSYSEEAYSVLHYVFLQVLEAEDSKTIDDRERVLLKKVINVLSPDEFCYLNVVMKVRFPLSKEYSFDTDWERHTKTMRILELILSEIGEKLCILLDDVQYMDLMSWQFLSISLNNKNVVVGMTMLEPASWNDLSQAEVDICKDKRLIKRSLGGLELEFLAAFACQFLNVLAIPRSIERVLEKHSKRRVSWCEALLMSALQTEALNFVTMSPNEVVVYDLIFPKSSLLMKIPIDLTPEELAPPLHWRQMSSLNVCVSADRYMESLDLRRDVLGLRIDIYNRMKPYEQDLIKCAATLGRTFARNIVENIITNSTPFYTAKAVAKMMKIRILECAMIQRKDHHTEDTTFCTFKKRNTFSDMKHLITCECPQSRIFAGKSLPAYAHCRMLEFTSDSYRKIFYNMLSWDEKKLYHSKAANMLKEDARKCSTCGGGSFLKVPSMEQFTVEETPVKSATPRRQSPVHVRRERFDSRRLSIVTVDSVDFEKRRESMNIRRISVLPAFDDDQDDDDLSIMTLEIGNNKPMGANLTPEDSYEAGLKQFSYIDFRNCRCIDAINCSFWILLDQIKKSGEADKMTQLVMEYGAALIETAQSFFALKFLTSLVESCEADGQLIFTNDDTIVNTGIILVLMGDAYMALGNYPQARKMYTQATTLRTVPLKSNRAICYNTVIEKLRQKVLGFPNYVPNRVSGEPAALKLELAFYLRRLSTALMMQGEGKLAKLSILQSLRAGFESVGGFREKGEIYLNAVEVFRRFGNMELIRSLEKPVLMVIEKKSQWNCIEEILTLVHVFLTIYETRALRGELDEAVVMGRKVLKICNYLHITRMKLSMLPSLIQIMVWTKHVNESVDLLKELLFSSDEDIDESAITWYYALCLELLLDAGMILESYHTCYDHFEKMIEYNSIACVLRDPESLSRLTTCVCIWQLRMTTLVREAFVPHVETYTKNINHSKFSQIFNCCKGLECYLLILLNRLNIKKSYDIMDRLQEADAMIKILEQVSNKAMFIKPFLCLLEAYMGVLRGRKLMSRIAVQKAYRWSLSQGNKLMTAWIMQNKRTWKEAKYNNMAQYWVEHVGFADAIPWQHIHNFDLDAWSTILFPFPRPNFYL